MKCHFSFMCMIKERVLKQQAPRDKSFRSTLNEFYEKGHFTDYAGNYR